MVDLRRLDPIPGKLKLSFEGRLFGYQCNGELSYSFEITGDELVKRIED